MILNLFLFLFSCLVLWKSAGLVIQGIEKFSRNLRLSSFATSFLFLGFLTSITEISVGINSVLNKTPEIFVGNLIGGSFVIMLLIVPLTAILNKGITFKNHLKPKRLAIFLFIILCPSLLILDGQVSRYDALLLILLYGLFFFLLHKHYPLISNLASLEPNPKNLKTIGKIILGVGLAYFAAKILVDKTVYFAELLEISPFIVSLLVLSLGTNLPEIVIAVNSFKKKRSEIAFGDYIGSAVANPLLFGIFTFFYGSFTLNKQPFELTFFVILFGYALFFLFACSKNRLSALEGLFLLLVFILFVFFQTMEILIVF